VEASQLSRALTLAELKVFTEGDSSVEDCGCLTSRADLAFINVGYQVKILRSTAEDTSDQTGYTNSNPELAAIQERQKAIAGQIKAAEDAARELAEMNPAITGLARNINDPSPQVMIDQAVAEARQVALGMAAAEYGISVEQAKADVSEGEADDMIRPVASPTITREEAISRVETFLTNLYQTLDGPHQEYEKILRGEYLSIPVDTGGSRFSSDNTSQDIGPPFSPSGRSRGGDPAALAQQGSSAREEIAKQWNEFGEELKVNSKKAGLEEEIRQAQNRVNSLRQQVREAEAIRASGGTVLLGQSVEALQQQLAGAEQDLMDKQQELATLHSQ
jgi:hypothetical protein